ncbi:MAG: hypothetical protein U0694_16150 [Anaerolineae bacterium]
MNDSELLEQFLQTLRQNPHAVPPPGLDPDMVEFARMLVQQVSSPNTEVCAAGCGRAHWRSPVPFPMAITRS